MKTPNQKTAFKSGILVRVVDRYNTNKIVNFHLKGSYKLKKIPVDSVGLLLEKVYEEKSVVKVVKVGESGTSYWHVLLGSEIITISEAYLSLEMRTIL